MEPFRPLVDHIVLQLKENDKDYKNKLNNLLNYEVVIDKKTTYLSSALVIYIRSIFEALEKKNPYLIKFVESYAL